MGAPRSPVPFAPRALARLLYGPGAMTRASFASLALVLVAALGSTGCSYRTHAHYGCRYANMRPGVYVPAPPPVPVAMPQAVPAVPEAPNQIVVNAPPGSTVVVVAQPGAPPVVRTVPAPQPQVAPPQPAPQPAPPPGGWSEAE